MLGLYRDEIDHPESDDRELAELSVLKKRQLGEEVGTIRRLVWVGEATRTTRISLGPTSDKKGKAVDRCRSWTPR